MRIRIMTEEDIDFAFECTDAEGWQGETKESFRAHLEYDRNGCFVAETQGRKIGICVATKYRNNGFIGELVVIREMRGMGAGKTLFAHSVTYLQHLGIRNIYLDGDLDAVPIYVKAGFRKVCRSLRFNGRISGEPCDSVRLAEPEDTDAVCRLDERLFGDDRGFFIKHRYNRFPGLMHIAEVNGEICGYIMAQPGNGILSVGPWAILNEAVPPAALLNSLAYQTGGMEMRIGMLETSTQAVRIIRSLPAFREEEYSWRMVLGPSGDLGTRGELYATGTAAKG